MLIFLINEYALKNQAARKSKFIPPPPADLKLIAIQLLLVPLRVSKCSLTLQISYVTASGGY